MWSKAPRFDALDSAGRGDEDAESDDDDIVLLGSPTASPTRAPGFAGGRTIATPPSAERVSPPRAGGLHRALRELSALRREGGDGAAAAAAAAGGRERRLASLSAADSAESLSGAAASVGSDEAYEMDDFEIEQDSSTSAEFEDGALQRVASVQTASPGSATSQGSADWAEDVEEVVEEEVRCAAAHTVHCSCPAVALTGLAVPPVACSMVEELVEDIVDNGELVDEVGDADEDLIVEDIIDEELDDEATEATTAAPVLDKESATRPRAGPSGRKSTAFAAPQQAPDDVVRWLEYENAQLATAEAERRDKPAPRFGRGGKQPRMRSSRPTHGKQQPAGGQPGTKPASAERGDDSSRPGNPSLVNELSARLASLDVGAQRSLLQTLQDLDGKPDTGSREALAMLQLAEPEPEPELEPELPLPVAPATAVPTITTAAAPGLATQGVSHVQTQRVRLRLISNWGGERQIGLSAVELFDREDKKIDVAPSAISVRGVRGDKGQPSRLLSRKSKGTETELDMWLCSRPAPPLYPDLDILVPTDVMVSRVRVYNYGAGNNCGKEVREMELFVDEHRRWQGVLNRGGSDGLHHTDISTVHREKAEPAAAPDVEVAQQQHQVTPATEVADTEGAALRRGSSLWFPGDVQKAKAKSAAAVAADTEGDVAAAPRRRRDRTATSDAEKDADAMVADLQIAQPVNAVKVSNDASWDSGSDAEEATDDVLGQLAARGHAGQRHNSEKSEVQDSWDSLTMFRKNNRARLDNTNSIEEAVNPAQEDPLQNIDIDNALEGAADLASYMDELDGLVSAGDRAKVVESEQQAGVDTNDFAISCLPSGRTLDVDIRTTWGDRYYVGLCGLELFDSEGEKIPRSAFKEIRAEPPGMNVLPDYSNDPRTVDNLFDGVNRTTDAFHLWLAPFTPGASHVVTIVFADAVTLSMIRVWNYNESRTSVARGARHVEILLDKNPVFRGEIRQAPGVLDGSEDDAECIFLTSDASLLKAIEAAVEAESESARREIEVDVELTHSARPSTSGSYRVPAFDSEVTDVQQAESALDASPTLLPSTETRPGEAVASRKHGNLAHVTPVPVEDASTEQHPAAIVKATIVSAKPLVAAGVEEEPQQTVVTRPSEVSSTTAPAATHRCRKVVLRLLSTWGDPHYIGLGGIEIIGNDGRPIQSSMIASLTANPRDLHNTPGYEGDLRRLENLLSGSQGSCDDTRMWLAPFNGSAHGGRNGGTNTVELELKESVDVLGIRIWNYNKDWDSSFRGARLVRIEADGVAIQSSRTIVLRKVCIRPRPLRSVSSYLSSRSFKHPEPLARRT